jgi:hypothetical protein
MNFDSFLQPAIFGLTGKPGAGKSYFATRLIIAEIKKGQNRTIVTNVPINRKKLREYVCKDFQLYDLETFTDNRHFFTNRGHYHWDLPDTGANIDFKEHLQDDDEGILYIIDEAHLYFNARNWKHMSQATLSYITFIRHVGDTLIWMAQKYSDVDSQFRGKTQAFHVLRNLSKEKVFNFFKRGTGFRCYQYLEEAHISGHGTQSGQSSQDFTYPFQLKIAECYSTSLFNKEHEKRYKLGGIPINWVVYAGALLLLGLIFWASQGGLPKMLSFLMPSVVSEESAENVNAQVHDSIPPDGSVIPVDPFDRNAQPDNSEWFEVPTIFAVGGSGQNRGNKNSQIHNPWELLDTTDYDRKKKYWFGEVRKCKITFISDKVTRESSTEFSFGAVWKSFAEINNISLATEQGIWSMQTNYFTGLLAFIRDNGQGANLKETDIILKENVPFSLVHGYQLPFDTSYATQGVIRSSKDYRDVGFSLDLIMQVIDGRELLKIDVENSDVMDVTSPDPIMQTFSSSNIVDVANGMTYQIADFRSMTSQVSKGILRKKDYSTEVTNKIFISYGDI